MKVDSRVNIKAVSEIVRELYGIQVKHAKQCGEIFESLFHITYDEKKNPLTISLSKNVLRGGFVEIDRINDRARKVLIDYYSMCEQKYVKGVNLIVEPMRREREVKRAADATRAAEAKAAEAKAAEERARTLTRTMSNQMAIRPVTATAPATETKPLLTFPARPAATAPAAPAAPAPSRAATATAARLPLAPTVSAPLTSRPPSSEKTSSILKTSQQIPVPKTRLTRQSSAPSSKGGTRKRHVMRQ